MFNNFVCVFFLLREADCYPIPLTEKLHITPVKYVQLPNNIKQNNKKKSQNNKVFVVKSTQKTQGNNKYIKKLPYQRSVFMICLLLA